MWVLDTVTRGDKCLSLSSNFLAQAVPYIRTIEACLRSRIFQFGYLHYLCLESGLYKIWFYYVFDLSTNFNL